MGAVFQKECCLEERLGESDHSRLSVLISMLDTRRSGSLYTHSDEQTQLHHVHHDFSTMYIKFIHR